jgi:hypothetical protein
MSPQQMIVPKPCNVCRDRIVRLADNGRMTCKKCKADRGQLDAPTLAFIKATQKHFGPLDEEIVLRSAASTQAKYDRRLVMASAKPPDCNDANQTRKQTS